MEKAHRLFNKPVDALTGYLALSILLFNIVDGYVSAHVVKNLGQTELNEFYAQLLKEGAHTFLIWKLSFACLLIFFSLIAKNGKSSQVVLWFFYIFYSGNAIYLIAILTILEFAGVWQ